MVGLPLLVSVLSLMLADAALGVPVATQPLTQKEALDMFFKSVDAHQRFGDSLEAIKKMGVVGVGPLLDRWRNQGGAGGGAGVKLPWHDPAVMGSAQRVADVNLDKLVEMARRIIETTAEPLKLEFINLNQSNPLLNVIGYVMDASISQLSTFKVEDIQLDLLTVSAALQVTFEKLDAHGLYNVDATASQQLHVFGDGHFDVRLYEPSVKVDVRLGYNEEHFSMEELQIYIKLAKLKVVMSNFLGGGEVGDLVCGIVSDVGPAFLDEYKGEINQLLSSEIKETANALLAKIPINSIIDWITGGGKNKE